MWEWKNMWIENICLSNLIMSPNVHQFSRWKFKKQKTFNTTIEQKWASHDIWGFMPSSSSSFKYRFRTFASVHSCSTTGHFCDWSSEQITIESKDIRDFRNSIHFLANKSYFCYSWTSKIQQQLIWIYSHEIDQLKKNGWSFLYPSWIDSKSISSSFSSSAEVSNSVNIQIGVFLSWFDGLQIAKSLEDSVVV